MTIKKYKKAWNTKKRTTALNNRFSKWRKSKFLPLKKYKFNIRKNFKKFTPKSRISYPSQEKFLRSRIVSRKFKMTVSGQVGSYEPIVKPEGLSGSDLEVYTRDLIKQAGEVQTQYGLLGFKSMTGAKKFLGHIAEYEDFAISYIKVKTKCNNKVTVSYIRDNSLAGVNIGLQNRAPQEALDGLFIKHDAGNPIVVRKQNLLAAHKVARTSPWIKSAEYVNAREGTFDAQMFPTYPVVDVSVFDNTKPSFCVTEYTVYCVTKNRMTKNLDERNELVELKNQDRVDIQAVKVDEAKIDDIIRVGAHDDAKYTGMTLE